MMLSIKNKRSIISGIFLLLVTADSSLAASRVKQENAAPKPTVVSNIIVSVANPSLAIDVDQKFTYLGRHPIRIRDVAAGERLIFAYLDGPKARRLFIIQLEGFLPGIEDHYRYNLSASPVVAGYPFRSNAYAFDLPESVARNPGLESAATNKFLSEIGILPPKQLMMWRSLTVTSRDKRNEMILFYIEDVSAHNITLDDIYDPVTGKDTAVWKALQPALERRANASFRLTELDEQNKPRADRWQQIPLGISR